MRLLTLFRLPFALAVVFALGASVGGHWILAVLALLVATGVFVLGRDPVREVPAQPLGIVSPIDGRVTEIGHAQDPFLERDALCIRIEQPLLAPALMCSPTEGRVERLWGGPDMPGYADGNRLGIHLRTDEGDDVVFVVTRPRILPGPLDWRVQPGERVGQGQHRGLAGWGRQVTLYVPARATPAVESATVVHAGSGLVCQLVHGA